MRNMITHPARIGNSTIKNWMLGVICGVLLTIGLIAVIGSINMHHRSSVQSVPPVPLATAATSGGLVPPDIDEYRRLHDSRAALPASTTNDEPITPAKSDGMIPPPIDELRSSKLWPSASTANSGAPPMPIPGSTKY
jgi:hypothetical protein